MLTSNQYTEQDGAICPFCQSDEIEGDDLTFEAAYISQRIDCRACNRHYFDDYKLVGYSLPAEGEEASNQCGDT